MASNKLLTCFFFPVFHVSLEDAKHPDKQELKKKILEQGAVFVKMTV